jgi:hypothetical protein
VVVCTLHLSRRPHRPEAKDRHRLPAPQHPWPAAGHPWASAGIHRWQCRLSLTWSLSRSARGRPRRYRPPGRRDPDRAERRLDRIPPLYGTGTLAACPKAAQSGVGQNYTSEAGLVVEVISRLNVYRSGGGYFIHLLTGRGRPAQGGLEVLANKSLWGPSCCPLSPRPFLSDLESMRWLPRVGGDLSFVTSFRAPCP